MDPVTALSVAAATVQFIVFAGDVVSKSREIYHSADGTLLGQNELSTIAKSLRTLCAPFRHWDPADGRHVRANETALQLSDLCKRCVKIAVELDEALQKLKVHGAHHQKWKSFRQALNSVKSESEIEQICTRLDRYRAQIDTTLLFIIRNKIDQVDQHQIASSAEISTRVLGVVEENRKWQAELIETIHKKNWDHRDQGDVQDFSVQFSTHTDSQRKKFIEADILKRLRFQTMEDRHDRIPQVYRETFEWVFQEPALVDGEKQFDSYLQWLEGEEPIYWITGKPGAGKSTLMKYLFNDSRTRQNAGPWSRDAELILAGFFFWNSGTELQMAREGLLQTLLYQVVRRNKSLIPSAFHDCWQNYELLGGDVREKWVWTDLVKFFKTLISETRRKYVFFIDGLDEFAGDHSGLVDFISEISQFTNVKLCVASRPWLAFEEAFGKRPRLKVETLTRSDIRKFVSEKLRMSQRFLALELDEPSNAELLINEVTGKAFGVFLWVYLVVRSLQEGLRDGDTMKDLLTRISILPSDLEELFRKILDRLDTFYFKQASILFQLMDAAVPRPLTVLSIAFAEEGFDYALEAETKPLDRRQFSSRAESVRRRLNSRSKGLLEATPVHNHPEHAQVQYLHRSVKDFLARRDVWTYITSGTDSTFNASVTLCGTYLMHLKTAQTSAQQLGPIWDAVRGCLDHACRAQEVLGRRQTQFLDEMDKAITQVLKVAENSGSNLHFRITHWTDTLVGYLDGPEDCTTWMDCYPCTSFVEFAACRGLYHDTTHDMRLIEFLLEQKADPNILDGQGISPWQVLLRRLDSSFHTAPEVWYELVTIFLDHGANPESNVHNSPAFAIIETAFGGWNFGKTKALLQKLLAMRPLLKQRKDWPKAIFKRQHGSYFALSTAIRKNTQTLFALPDWATGV